MREKICFGGTFNPIHHGHLLCARAAAEAVGAGRVVLFPTGEPAHRAGQAHLAASAHRVQMCRLAIEGIEGFEIDDRECRRAGPTFTIDTARELRRQGWDKVTWLIGADMLNSLPKWREPEALLEEVEFLVMARPGIQFDWDGLPARFRFLRENVVAVPQIDISATEVRRRVGLGKSIEFFCPPAVCRYIAGNGLYLGAE
jgi:nicotinate-nucleotide adenylyltransferase